MSAEFDTSRQKAQRGFIRNHWVEDYTGPFNGQGDRAAYQSIFGDNSPAGIAARKLMQNMVAHNGYDFMGVDDHILVDWHAQWKQIVQEAIDGEENGDS